MPPRLARLLAAVVAVALVAGAFALRGALADDDAPSGSGRSAGGDDPEGGDGSAYRLVCDEDLGEVCDAVREATGAEVEVLPAGALIDAEDVPFDAWLTLDPMPAVLDAGRVAAGGQELTSGPATPLASSTLALLALEEPLGACADDPAIEWSCLVDPPEEVRPGVAVPSDDTAVGILARAAGATGLEGGDTDFGIGAYQGTENADLLEGLLDDSPSQAGSATADQADAMFNPGTATAAVTVEGVAAARADTVRGGERGLRVVPLAPDVVVGVVVAGLGADGEEAVAALEEGLTGQTVLAALTDAGWTGGDEATSGLPDADVIYGLREELG